MAASHPAAALGALPAGEAHGRWRRGASVLLMMASGFAGLGYQIVWTQQSALWLGHESAAVLAVVAAFFGGLGIGALALGPCIEDSARPIRWYAACELIIGVWSGALVLGLAPVSAWMLRLTGAQPSPFWQWTVAFLGTFLVLLPATAAMGGTLPAMERAVAGLRTGRRSLAALYAGNTLGATLGVLAIAFWLAPALGLAATAGVCIALNLLCGAASLALFTAAAHRSAIAPVAADRHGHPAVPWRLVLTGFLGIGYEVLVVRVLSQVAEDTVYTFAMLLAVYLVGTAAGAAGYDRWLARAANPARLVDQLLTALATACLAGTVSLWGAAQMKAMAQGLFGAGMTAALAAEAVPALVAFGPATLIMGALFSHLSECAGAAGHSFGRSLGANTLGASVAPLAFGVVLLPAIGPKCTLLAVSLGYLALITWASWRSPLRWLAVGVAFALGIWAPPLAFVDVPDGGRLLSYQDGVVAAVSVVEDAAGVSRLRIDNREQEGSSDTLRFDSRLALLPLYLHRAPKRALFLGLGTGVTAASAAQEPDMQVDAVELLPEVIAASTMFTRSLPGAEPGSRLRLMAADARRYVRANRQRYDVIVADNFHPARSGSGSLYTAEHFLAVRERLAPGGLFCQWLPLHQLDLETLRSIVQSYIHVYPHGWALLASNSLETPVLGLIARADDDRLNAVLLGARLAGAAPAGRLARVGLEDEFALLGGFVGGPASLKRFAGSAPLNTDDHPVVAYLAPRITYAPDSQPRDRLAVLLTELSIDPDELLLPAEDTELPRRLAAYWVARDRFIDSGRHIRPSRDVRDMLAQVREPLLAVLRISPDFRPAYDPLLRMGSALAQFDTAGAQALLQQLVLLQPQRIEAAVALRHLEGTTN